MKSAARAVVMAAALLTAACTSVVDGVPPPAGPRPSVGSASPTSASPTTVPPGNGLRGYGATKATFAATHAKAPSSSPGCCYGPIVRIDDGLRIPTWNIANSPGDVIILLIHNFALTTDGATASRRVVTRDLPSDVRLIRSAVIDGGRCHFALYESPSISRALDVEFFSVRLFSPHPPGTAPRYLPSSIEQAKIITGEYADCST